MQLNKLYLSLILLLIFFSCTNNSDTLSKVKEISKPTNHILKIAFQSILDSAKVKGAILVYDAQQAKYYSNDFEWANQGQLPASTFKIPNSMVALETGVVENDSTFFE